METGHQKLKDEQDFYNKMDHATKGTYCSCFTLTLLFAILIIGVSAGTYFLARNLLSGKKLFSNSKVVLIPPIFHRQSNPSSSSFSISEKDIQSNIWQSPELLLPLTDKKILIQSDGLIITGQVPVTSEHLELLAIPSVKAGKIIISSTRINKGPTTFQKEFSGLIKGALTSQINKLAKKKTAQPLKTIKLEKGRIIIGI